MGVIRPPSPSGAFDRREGPSRPPRGQSAGLATPVENAGPQLCERATAPLDSAMTQNNLGVALSVLGERETVHLVRDALAVLETRQSGVAHLEWRS